MGQVLLGPGQRRRLDVHRRRRWSQLHGQQRQQHRRANLLLIRRVRSLRPAQAKDMERSYLDARCPLRDPTTTTTTTVTAATAYTAAAFATFAAAIAAFVATTTPVSSCTAERQSAGRIGARRRYHGARRRDSRQRLGPPQ